MSSIEDLVGRRITLRVQHQGQTLSSTMGHLEDYRGAWTVQDQGRDSWARFTSAQVSEVSERLSLVTVALSENNCTKG